MATYKGRFTILNDPASAWASADPVLLLGELAVGDVTTTVPVLKCGDSVRPWSALPNLMAPVVAANDYVVGSTTTLPPGSSATVDIDNTVDPPTISFGLPAGATGPANSLSIGSVVTGPPGSGADASITGSPPNQILNLTIPAGVQGPVGPTGAVGPAGPPNSLAIGTVTTGAPGSPAGASITGTAPNQTLNLTLPQGAQGPQGIQGIQGPPGSIALADPTALLGLAAINGSSLFAMRSDAAPALSQAIAPTWTARHTFSNAAAQESVLVNGQTLQYGVAINGHATGHGLLVQGGTTGEYVIRARASVAAGSRNLFVVKGQGTVEFGNNTDNPTYTFFGTGATSYSGYVHISVNNTSGLTAIFDSANAQGSFVSFRRSAVPYSFMGNAAALIPVSGVLDGFAIRTEGATPIIFGTSGGAEVARFTSSGQIQITGNFGGAYRAAAGVELGMSGGMGKILSYNRGTSAYNDIAIDAISLTLTDPTAGHAKIWFGARLTMSSLNDGYLRLNDGSGYANGIYTPGQIRASGGFQADAGIFGATTPSNVLRPNASNMTYGSVWVSGATSGYAGYSINDPMGAHFMSDGVSTAGIYIQTDSKWLFYRNASTTVISGYNLSAPSFTTTSARALKRETGAPSRASNILARLRPILYRLLADEDREQLGLIAEEVHAVCPQLSDGHSVSYDRLAILLLAAWQEQNVAA